MAKLIVWIAVVFAVLFGLRLFNAAGAKRRHRAGDGARNANPPVNPMVRCARCGVFLPKADAKPAGKAFICGDASCGQHR